MRISQVADLFTPIMHILRLKLDDEEKALVAAEKFQAWMKDGTPRGIPGDLDLGDIVEEELDEKMNVWRAFEGKGVEQRKKPLSLLCDNLSTVDEYAELTDKALFKMLRRCLLHRVLFLKKHVDVF